jgi:integrase
MKTYREVAERYLKQPSRRLNRSKGDSAVRYTRYAIARFGDREIDSFSKRDVTMYVEDMRDQGYANGTINARMRYFLAVLNYALRDLELISSVPHFDKLPAANGGRVLSDMEVQALLAALPPARAEMMRFALETGLRGANVKGLRWDQVNEQLWQLEIPAELAKGGKTLYLPLSDGAIALLKARRSAQSDLARPPEFVFTQAGGRPFSKNTKMTGNSWRTALKRAGLEGITFHDMRHTWATRHIVRGTPPSALKELGGWANLEMVERYTHMNTSALREVVNNCSDKVLADIAITDSAA